MEMQRAFFSDAIADIHIMIEVTKLLFEAKQLSRMA
jgi:hypothetical protein